MTPNPILTSNKGRWLRLVLVVVVVAVIYALIAGPFLRRKSIAPYFVYLAESFTQGRLDLPDELPNSYDLIFYNGRQYVAQQPLPSLFLTPIVALIGIGHTSDVLFDIAFGVLNVAACGVMLELAVPDLNLWKRDVLVLTFGLGTVFVTLATPGTVWFTGQVVASFFLWTYLWAVWRHRSLLAGISLGLVLLGRPSVVPGALILAAGMFGAWILQPNQRLSTPVLIRRLIRDAVLLLVPLCIAAAALGAYNAARFGSVTDFGYQYLNDAANIRARREAHGAFSPVFFAENLTVATIRPPLVTADCGSSLCIAPDPWGMGILWTSPLLLIALLAVGRDSQERRQNLLLAATFFATLLPSLLYHNTGSAQFGYRFLLDALPILMILVARGARRVALPVLSALALYGFVVNVAGALWLIALIEPNK